MIRNYPTLPHIPDAGLLDRYLDTLGVIVPLARTNLITNPSAETNTTGYSGTAGGETIARSTTQQARGAYSIAVTPTVGTSSGVQRTVTTVASSTYAASADIWGAPGVPYLFRVVDGGGTVLASYSFTGTGKWIRPSAVVTAASVSTLIQVIKNGSASTAVFYTDGWQMELCAAGEYFATTYIDGDQMGLIPNQYPPAYGWTGTPHASTSYRTGQTRAGGRIVRLKDLGFLLTAIIGLGLAPPRHEALTFAQLDGGQYQTTIKPPRTFSIAGRVAAGTPNEADAALAQLGDLVDRDRVALRQPLVLTMQAQECGVDCGNPVFVQAIYSGGLEGNTIELPTHQVPITFTQYLPFITSTSQGAALTVQQSVANTNAIAQRSPSGVWSAISTGMSGGAASVYALARGLDGTIYAGGDFTDAGGSGADYLAKWNPATGIWSIVRSATALNGVVFALTVGPDGKIYIGGSFTNADGIAAADYIAVYDPVANTYAALSTGMDNTVNALAFAPNGTLYATGSFTTAGGGAARRIASWNGSAWSALGTGLDPAGAGVGLALVVGPDNTMYVGGGFTNAGGTTVNYIAAWNGSAFSALAGGMGNVVRSIAFGPNGALYAGGDFTTAGGVSANRIAAWNGVSWAPLGSGLNNSVSKIAVLGDGRLLVGGTFTTAGGITVPDSFAIWNGAAWIYADIDLPGSPNVFAILVTPDDTIYIGFTTTGTATSAAITTVTNSGNVDISPTLTIAGPSSGTSRIYQLINMTSGVAIYLNLTLNAGEVATLTLNPTNVTFVSTFQGNILSTILPGSQEAFFALQPGANNISFFAASSSVTAVLQWPLAYTNLNKALYQATTP